MSSDAFIVSSARLTNGPNALRQAVELAGVHPARVQDAIFGLAASSRRRDLDSTVRLAGLECPAAVVSPSLRLVFFAADAILSGSVDVLLAAALDRSSTTAFVLASAEAVGRSNLLPRARLAARSLAGAEPAARLAGLALSDVEICKEAASAAVLHDLLAELEGRPAHWGFLTSGPMALLIERL